MECQSSAGPGAAPASVAAADISASPLEVGWPGSLVRKDHGEVSPLWREGMSPVGGSPSIPPVTGGPLLAPRSYPRCLVGPSCERLSLTCLVYQAGKATGLPRCADVPEGVGSRLYAGGSTAAPGEFGAPGPGHIPFWSKRFSSLRLSFVTTLATLHLD